MILILYNFFMEEKEIGIVIKKIDYDDYDQIVTILTEKEIITFIALGVRKMTSTNRIPLQLGNIIEVEIFRARLKDKISKLKRANLIKQLPIKSSDTALVWMIILKYLSHIKEAASKLFRSILETYSFWGKDLNHHIKTYIIFHFLETNGIKPMDKNCIDCGRYDRINGFEFYKGGFTCYYHSKKVRSLEYLKGIQNLFAGFNKYKETSAFINKSIFQELVAYLNET